MAGMKTVAYLLLTSAALLAHEGHPHAPAAAKKLVSPIANTADDLAAGKKLYAEKCAACHGADGRLAAGAKVKATDLTSHHVAMLTPGEIYWVVTHGIPMSGMPGNPKLSVNERWQVVGYTRGLAGTAR
jgi:mono/diheme cytochrome c family protein